MIMSDHSQTNHSQTNHSQLGDVALSSIDRVCGITITPERTAVGHEHEGVTYYFCSIHCLYQFKADPQAFLKQTPSQIADGKEP